MRQWRLTRLICKNYRFPSQLAKGLLAVSLILVSARLQFQRGSVGMHPDTGGLGSLSSLYAASHANRKFENWTWYERNIWKSKSSILCVLLISSSSTVVTNTSFERASSFKNSRTCFLRNIYKDCNENETNEQKRKAQTRHARTHARDRTKTERCKSCKERKKKLIIIIFYLIQALLTQKSFLICQA